MEDSVDKPGWSHFSCLVCDGSKDYLRGHGYGVSPLGIQGHNQVPKRFGMERQKRGK
jgi:hypothetical protein